MYNYFGSEMVSFCEEFLEQISKTLFSFGFEAGFGANVANKTSWKREMLSNFVGENVTTGNLTRNLTLFVLCYCKQTAVNEKVPGHITKCSPVAWGNIQVTA